MAIHCSNGHENPDGTFFCEACGELLSAESGAHKIVRVCTRCGQPNQPDAGTCVRCGEPLVIPAGPHEQLAALIGRPCLVVHADGAIFDLTGKDEIIVGRADPACDIYPDIDLTEHGGDDGGVSRIHVRVRQIDGRYTLEDQKSINYTFLNKQRLEPYVPTPLKAGDEIRLGRVVLYFVIEE